MARTNQKFFLDHARRVRAESTQRRVLAALALLAPFAASPTQAAPQGGVVRSGSASITQNGGQTSIRAGQNAVIDWRSFNIAAGETTTFIQPSATSVVWNRILDVNPSSIHGHLNANGYVVLFNQSGFYFGAGSVVNVGGLVVSTAPMQMPGDGGANWQYSGPPPLASIINYGTIKTAQGGSMYLVAEKIENHGVLMAPDGTLGLYAGKEVLVTDSPDGRGLSVKVKLPQGSVDNFGRLVADAGTIALRAEVVNQNGRVQADSVREHNGVIELFASDSVQLGAESVISARGDDGVSPGGAVIVKSDRAFTDAPGSLIDIRGGTVGGAGGTAEISAPRMAAIHSRLDGTAQPGFTGGRLLIDPTDIVLSNGGVDSAPGGIVAANDPGDTLTLDVNSAFVGLSQISLQATRDIFLNTTWNLAASTGLDEAGHQLTLQAGRDILFQNGAAIQGGQNWSVRLEAGVDFTLPTPAPVLGRGGIYFNGGPDGTEDGSLETGAGSIALRAGNEIIVAGGFIRTGGGGALSIETLAGDVDAGFKPDTYDFRRTGYTLSALGVGGIATTAGGDLTIQSGRDVLSFLPTTGAFGAEAANVNITAVGRVFGNYLVRHGVGTIQAGTDFGSLASPGSLSLISGGWNVTAANNIFVSEVRNPNGIFNGAKISRVFNGAVIPDERRVTHYFDYAPDAFANFFGGHSVQLLGSNLPRPGDAGAIPPIYAPRLSIEAGAGGVILGNSVLLYPSSQGSLSIHTTGGGGLSSLPGTFNLLAMSDSSAAGFATFQNGHAATPLHQNDPGAVRLDLAGDIRDVVLQSPMRAQIDVGGSTYNFGLELQNLAPTDKSWLHIGGDYLSRGNITIEPVAPSLATPNMTIFSELFTVNREVGRKLFFDPASRKLVFQGRMTESERDFLLNPSVLVYTALGNPLLDANGGQVTRPAIFASAATVQNLFARSQDIPSDLALANSGLQISGPGTFELTARTLDLGRSGGLQSVGVIRNPALAAISPFGANLSVRLQGDLLLASSQILSFSGGAIDIDAQGSVNVGTQESFFEAGNTPKGIYTSGGGGVSVVANGDVNVNGSRIATYDGGNIKVQSRNGDVNAGEGGLGSVQIFRTLVNPITGEVTLNSSSIPGSGIIATTLRNSDAKLGNIEVSAGRDIIANKGGILQIGFNHNPENDHAQINLVAIRNIEAKNSGIIGGNISLKAGGDISGLIIARENINIDTVGNVSVTALAQGSIGVSAGTLVGTTLVGNTVNADAGSISGTTIAANQSTVSGANTAGTTVSTASTAPPPAATKTTEDASTTVAAVKKTEDEEDPNKKKKPLPQLVRTSGRVTVILPPK